MHYRGICAAFGKNNMLNTEKLTEYSLENLERLSGEPAEEQIIEGEVENIDDWASLLPEGVAREMVISKETSDGKRRCWKLLPEYIKDEDIRAKEMEEEEEVWRGIKQSN